MRIKYFIGELVKQKGRQSYILLVLLLLKEERRGCKREGRLLIMNRKYMVEFIEDNIESVVRKKEVFLNPPEKGFV